MEKPDRPADDGRPDTEPSVPPSEMAERKAHQFRRWIQAEAAAAGAVFVDPLTDKWFVNDTGKLVGSDGVHLTDQGHKYLADQLQPRIAAALG